MYLRFLFFIISLPLLAVAQQKSSTTDIDAIDVARKIFAGKPPRRSDTTKDDKARFTVLPAFGYTLQTGFAAVLSGNVVFKTHKDTSTHTSIVYSNCTYSQYEQIILPLQSYIWTRNNKYNITTDWRYMKYPQFTFGLGGNTPIDAEYMIDYSNFHFHNSILRKIAASLYAGPGYNFDYFWNINEMNPPEGILTDYREYGLTPSVAASGPTFNVLYDDRLNPVNPMQGVYGKLVFRPNFIFLGSDANWGSMVVDVRKYWRFPQHSRNVIALWTYDWFTTHGKPPYEMLPSTAWDPNNNTGRGYIQGRFRGRNMLYLETEYRFALTNNGLLGAVVYANAQSFTDKLTNKFNNIAPGAGVGLRIKLNKFSNTNVAIDYAFGEQGSRGFWVNLGEVF